MGDTASGVKSKQEIVTGFESVEALVGPVKRRERSGAGVAGGWVGYVFLKISLQF